MVSGDYYYQLIEAPDITLACITTTGVQNWVLGILRAPYFAPTGSWELFAVDPTVVPIIKAGCSLQYPYLNFTGLCELSANKSYFIKRKTYKILRRLLGRNTIIFQSVFGSCIYANIKCKYDSISLLLTTMLCTYLKYC